MSVPVAIQATIPCDRKKPKSAGRSVWWCYARVCRQIAKARAMERASIVAQRTRLRVQVEQRLMQDLWRRNQSHLLRYVGALLVSQSPSKFASSSCLHSLSTQLDGVTKALQHTRDHLAASANDL